MKFTLTVLAILSLVASAYGDVDGGAPATETGSQCTIKIKDPSLEVQPYLRELILIQSKCIGDTEQLMQNVQQAKDKEASRLAILRRCEGATAARECLVGVEETAKLCLDVNGEDMKVFKTSQDFYAATIAVSCANNSEIATMFFHGLAAATDYNADLQEELLKCTSHMTGFGYSFESMPKDEFTHFRYTSLKNFNKCLVNGVEHGDDNTSGMPIGKLFNEITARMTCICKKHGTVDLCEKVVNHVFDRVNV